MDSFFSFYVLPGLIVLLQSVVLIVILLVGVAYILYADRKIWAAVQLRRGPNVVGPWGTLQAFADLLDRKSTRLNSSHSQISYAVFCLKKKKKINNKSITLT